MNIQKLLQLLFSLVLALFLTACGGGSKSPLHSQSSSGQLFTKQQRSVADQFVSIFENGTTKIQYDYAEDIDDGRGITAGRVGFTSATGDMLIVIKAYKKVKPDNSLNQYLPELKRLEKLRYESGDKKGSASTKKLVGLIKAWKENSKLKSFRDIQDKVTDDLYFNPSIKAARNIGAKYPLTVLSLYDTAIQHGVEGLVEIIAKVASISPEKGGDEIVWLQSFNSLRLGILKANKSWKDSVARVYELQDMIKDKNYTLKPFTMNIDVYDNEEHILE